MANGIAAAESERRDRPMLKVVLRVLRLGGSLDLGDAVVSNLAALPQGEFAILGISFPPGTEFAPGDLAELRAAQSLQLLELQETAATDEDLQTLRDLSHLQQIDLRETRVSQVAVDRLRESLPKTIIHWEDFAADRRAAKHVLTLGGSVRLRAAEQEADFTQGNYAMRLEFGEISGGNMPGKIYLCVPGKRKSLVRGTFMAKIQGS